MPMALVYAERTITVPGRVITVLLILSPGTSPSQHPFEIEPEIPYFTDARIKQRA